MTDYDELIRTAISVADGVADTIGNTKSTTLATPAGASLLLAGIASTAIAQTRLLAAILERLDTPTTRPGPCGNTYRIMAKTKTTALSVCNIDHGHAGAHTDGTRIWGNE